MPLCPRSLSALWQTARVLRRVGRRPDTEDMVGKTYIRMWAAGQLNNQLNLPLTLVFNIRSVWEVAWQVGRWKTRLNEENGRFSASPVVPLNIFDKPSSKNNLDNVDLAVTGSLKPLKNQKHVPSISTTLNSFLNSFEYKHQTVLWMLNFSECKERKSAAPVQLCNLKRSMMKGSQTLWSYNWDLQFYNECVLFPTPTDIDFLQQVNALPCKKPESVLKKTTSFFMRLWNKHW